MTTPALLDRYELLAAWRRLTPNTESVEHYRYELDELGEAVPNPSPSARRQIVLTDVYCHLTERMGHLAAMSFAQKPLNAFRRELATECIAMHMRPLGQRLQIDMQRVAKATDPDDRRKTVPVAQRCHKLFENWSLRSGR